VSQRRRWLNGSFFAAVHSLIHFGQIYSSPHSFLQKLIFTIQFVYNAIQVWFTWFSIGNFFLSFYFLFDIRKGVDKNPESEPGIDPFYPAGDAVFQVLRGLYIYGLATMCITALGNRPRGTRWLYKTMSAFFAMLMLMMLFMGVWSIRLAVLKFYSSTAIVTGTSLLDYLKSTPEFRDMVVAVGTSYGIYLLTSIIHFDPWHIFTSMFQYLLLLPTYNNIFMIYSFCNLHDVSWGTKGATVIHDSAPASKIVNSDGTAVYEYISTDIDDINEGFNSNLKRLAYLKQNREDGCKKRDHKTKQEDQTRSFRTKIVLFWLFCNSALVVLFTNDASLKYFFPKINGSVNPYLTFLFWSFAGLALFRFTGSLIYIIQWFGERLSDFGGSNDDEVI
jgi:chitin synthase